MVLTVLHYQDYLVSGVSLSSSIVNEAQHLGNCVTLSYAQGKIWDLCAHCGLIECAVSMH